MSFAGMVASLLGEPVELAAWTGPVLVHKVVDLESVAPPEPQRQQLQEDRQSAATGRGDAWIACRLSARSEGHCVVGCEVVNSV